MVETPFNYFECLLLILVGTIQFVYDFIIFPFEVSDRFPSAICIFLIQIIRYFH